MSNIGTRSPLWRMAINIAILIVGIIFAANPAWTSMGVDIAFGVVLIVYGAATIALDEIRRARHEWGGNFVWGCLWLAAGILLTVFARDASTWLLPLVAGIWMLLEACQNVHVARIYHQTGETGAAIASMLGVGEFVLAILALCGMAARGYATSLPGVAMLLFGIFAALSFLLDTRAGQNK